MRETIIRDDLTGQQADDTTATEIMFGDDTFTLDLTPASVETLMAWFRDHDRSAMQRVFAPADSKKTRKHVGKSTDYSKAREWCQSNGIHVSDRGKLKTALMDAWRSGNVSEARRVAA